MADENVFAPMPEIPSEISRAIFGITPAERPDPFLASIAPVPNPWVKKSTGDTRLDYVSDEDEEEIALRAPIENIRKLFQPAAPVRIAPKLGDLRSLPEEPDAEEREFLSPVAKLFYPDVTAQPTPAKQFTKRASAPAKEKPALKYKKIVIDEVVWNEGRDESGEVQSMMLVLDESEE